MKDEIKKILKESIWQMKNANEDFLDGYRYVLTFDEIQEETLNDILTLVFKTIEEITLTELAEVFDEYKTPHPSGQGHVFYDVHFISMVQDIINIIKERCK